jgi:hypothetical protein
MRARLTVYCRGRDREGKPTHARTVVADLGIDEQVGTVLMPTAQQRGNPQAGRPRAVDQDLKCLLCGDAVRVGKPPHKRLRRLILRAQAAEVREMPLQALRAQRSSAALGCQAARSRS